MVPTVPQPFKLATDTHASARARRAAREREAQQQQSCTFRPHTIESAKRADIQRLLRDGEELVQQRRHGRGGM